jgi:RHS repeat-associated protein
MSTTTNYIWDEENYLAETDGANTVNTVYTNEPAQYGNLISSRISGTTRYHHFDAIGSTRQLTNDNGHATDTAIYDAWGNVLARTGLTSFHLQWIGQSGYYYDSENMALYVRARVYNSTTARWLSLDPERITDGVSRYGYSSNSTPNLSDPSGKAPNFRCYSCGPISAARAILGRCCNCSLSIVFSSAQSTAQETANAIYPPPSSIKNRALRHCIASALLARDYGCSCARCVGRTREQFQNECCKQDPREGDRGEFNNNQGRMVSGCPDYTKPAVGPQDPPAKQQPTDAIINQCDRLLREGVLDMSEEALGIDVFKD